MKHFYKIFGLLIIVLILCFNYFSKVNNIYIYIAAIFVVGTLIASEGYLILLWLFGRKASIDENVVKLIISLAYNDKELAKKVLEYYHKEKELKYKNNFERKNQEKF